MNKSNAIISISTVEACVSCSCLRDTVIAATRFDWSKLLKVLNLGLAISLQLGVGSVEV